MKIVYVYFLWMVLPFSMAKGTPLEDLASPVQRVRDAAAAELRVSFLATPETKWTPIIDEIKKGQSKTEILELLSAFDVSPARGIGSGQSHSESYRLDSEWILTCSFRNKGDILIGRRLSASLLNIWTPPSKHFTGTWVGYFVNGQKSHQVSYKDGKYFGEFIAYHSNGSKSYVQHYTGNVANGADTGYFPSGKVTYRGQYKSDEAVGTWTWYNESGEITSTRQHADD